MTEFELLQAISVASDKIALSAMNVVAVIFAYILAVHFAGKTLTRAMAVFTSVLYSFFLVAPVYAAYIAVLRIAALTDRYRAEFPASDLVPMASNVGLTLLLTLAPLAIGWIGSLAYMHLYIRNEESRP